MKGEIVMSDNVKFVWLNIATGEFSNSWSLSEHQKVKPYMKENDNWKLIKYEALNDKNFEFSNLMRIK